MMEHNIINDDALDPVSGGAGGYGPRSTKNQQLEYELECLQKELMDPSTSAQRKLQILIRMKEIKEELKKYDRS
ncbi:MAG: hypothetical protein IK139_09215 [Lachnospiraceae bacterium]|nr:hypothetical protein [Lachnospiraceae bacterium]